MQNTILSAVLIAATFPFVVSILSAFSPRTRVKGITGYFLYDRNLDIDSFLKTTVGYSLQVASIALFFYWTFTYGIVGPLIVCAAWTGGYLLVASAVNRGRFNAFLGTGRDNGAAKTIHGFIGDRMPPHVEKLKKWGVLIVSLASVIGLGGTMMTEIDYSAGYFMNAMQIPLSGTEPSLLRLAVEMAVLMFTVLYVLWGGYKSAVFTDRFQTPIAYVSFALFGFGAALMAKLTNAATGISITILGMVALFAVLLVRRRRLLKEVLPADSWDQVTTFLTFVPIVVFGAALLFYLGAGNGTWSWAALKSILFLPKKPIIGFGLWGTIALVFANGIWQFIDISSLQRLQSLNKEEVSQHKSHVVRALRVTGVEAGIGWFLIVLTAVLLRALGMTNDNFIDVLFGAHAAFPVLLPIFMFAVVIYMLSTISGFISALSFISFFDIVPKLTGRSPVLTGELKQGLHEARLVTIFVIVVIFVAYLLLRLSVPGGDIANVLYAIYAFQITIMPSALVAVFAQRLYVNPLAVIGSILIGICVAYWTAVHQAAWTMFSSIGMTGDSWQVIPPLASVIAATLFYVALAIATSPIVAVHGWLDRKRTKQGS